MSYKTTRLAVSPAPSVYFPLDETSGTAAADAGANGNSGTASVGGVLGGTTGIPADGSGKAALFSGSEQVDLTVVAGFPTGDAHYTVDIWFFTTSTADPQTLYAAGDVGTPGADMLFRMEHGALALSYEAFGDDLLAPDGPDLRGSWHYGAETYDGTNRRIYLDGVQVQTDVPGSAGVLTTTAPTIGAIAGIGQQWVGRLAHMAVTDGTALSAGTILALYNTGLGVPPNAPTGLTATPNIGTGAIDLAWTAPASGPAPDSYPVTRSTSTNTETSYHTGVAGLAYSDTGITPGGHYYYKVLSHTVGGGDSTPSAEANAIAPPAVHRANAVGVTVFDDTGHTVANPVVRVAINAPAGVRFAAGSDFFDVVPHDWTGNGVGVVAMTIVPPGDLTPAGLTYTITLRPDTAFARSFTTTSFAYSASAQTLADLLPLLPSISRVSMALAVVDDSANGVQDVPFSAQLLTDSLVAGTSPPTTALAAEIASDVTDANGVGALSLIPSSSLSGTLYKVRINNGPAFTITVPDGGGYLNDPANLRTAIPGGLIVATESSIATSGPGIVYHAVPVTLKDDLEMARWREWVLSWYGPRPPLTYGAGRFYY